MKSKTQQTLALAVSAAIIATAGFAASHVSTSDSAAVNARHAQMQLIAYNTGILGNMAKGEVEFDAAMAQSAAKNLNAAASLDRATLWIEGTEQGAVDGSRAKAEIWTDAAGFDAKFKALQDASAAVMDAADLDAVKAGMGPIGKACGDCHDTFRGPKT